MTDNLPEKIYTEKELARTRRNAKAVGWIQGGFAVFLVGLVLQFINWAPIVLGVGAVGFAGYKLFMWGRKDEEEAPDDPDPL